MNWEAVSAISEAIGVIAVIVTLLYLSRSIRQNSQSLAVAALGDITAQWNRWSDMLASSNDLAEIVAKGNRAYSSLSEMEALRYGAYVQSFFDIVESFRALVIDHNMEKDLTVLTSILKRRIGTAGFTAWWVENTADYGREFVAWVEAIRNDTIQSV
jgi:hypothetical protein